MVRVCREEVSSGQGYDLMLHLALGSEGQNAWRRRR